MNTKYLIYIAVALAIATIASASALALYYEGQLANLRSEISDLRENVVSVLVDDHGYVTSLKSYPTRIISLAPSNTEILFALGLDNKVVAVTDVDNYPYNFSAWIAAGNITSVGAFDNPNMEVIASLDPDLILATGGVQEETVTTLRDLGYKVLVLDPTGVDGVLKDILLVGSATNSNVEAALLVGNISSRIAAVDSKVISATSKPRVYYEVWYDQTSLWTAGSKAWQNELIEKAGGFNLFADQQLDYFQSSAEAVVERNPDVILLPAGGMGVGPLFWGSFDEVKARPAWSSISAVQNNRLYAIDTDVISHFGPRVADAIEALARFFHPELF